MADTQFDAMAKYLNLPDGTSIQIKEGETPAQARARAFEKYPEAFGYGKQAAPEAQPESGFTPALKAGYSGLKSGLAALAGKTGIMDPAAAEQYIAEQEKYQKQTYKPTATFGEAPVTKTLELLGGSLPYMAAPIAAGALAATAPVSAPVASALGIGAAGLASAGQFTGSNIIRQMEGEGEGAPKTALADTSLGSAFAAAVPQAALDAVSFKMLPGVRGLLSAAGKEVSPQIAKKIAEQGVKEVAKDYALATGKAMGTEGLTEAGQQFLERLQAGLSLTNEKARDEYIDSLIGGVVLGGVMSPAGRYVERRGEAAKQEEERLVKAREAQAAEEAEKEKEAAFRKTPEGQLKFVQEYEARLAEFNRLKALPKVGKDADPLAQVEYKESRKEMAKLREQLTRDSAEYRTAKEGAAQLLERQRVSGMTPEDYMLEQMGEAQPSQMSAQRRAQLVARGLLPAQPAAPAAPPKMRTVVDEFGQITEVPETPAAEPAAEPSKATQHLLDTANYLRSFGISEFKDVSRPEHINTLVDHLVENRPLAEQIVSEGVGLPELTRRQNRTLLDALDMRLKADARDALAERQQDLAGQLPKKQVGKRKAPDYDAYLEALDNIDFDRREGITESDIRELESLRRQTEVTDQGELFGAPIGQRTVLGNAPKTRQEYVADLRIARAARDRTAAEAAIANLRKLDDQAESQKKFQTGAAPEFRLTGEQRQRLFESGYTEEQIDEAERRAQKSAGQVLGAGQTPMSVAIQQLASDSRAEAFAKIVDLISRYNRGAARQEELNAARDRLVSGLITDIQQSRGTPLTDSERQDVTRDANMLLRELIERFGDTRTLSQKGPDTFVPAQTATGEFRTEPAPYMGFTTVESQAPGRRTFGNPLAAAQSIREGLEELRSRAITGDTTSFSRQYTPNRVSAEAVQTQLERELAKDPKSHSTEQRRILEAIGDNLRMMLRPESREDVSAWLYDLARDANNVSPELTQAVEDTLAAVEKSKRSETELETRQFAMGPGTRVRTAQQEELPLGPGRELQRTELAGPQRAAPVTEGAYSQISTAPSQEQTASTVFSNFAQLEKFLASDALQQVRSALGLGRPTLARLNARLQPFVAKIKDAQAKAEALSRQAQEIERRKRGELKALNEMTAKDAAAEERALTQAKQVLEESKRRLAELEAPLQKELAPFIKEFEKAQKQFEKAVAAQEETFVVMLRNREVFQARELAAIEKVYRIQERIKKARRKILGAFEEDFGKDPRNLARMMREFKESGKQAELNEQLAKAHEDLNKVFFDTRKDDTAVKKFLNQSFKFELEIQAQGATIDLMALKLLDAGTALQVVRDTQLDLSENKDAILAAKEKTQEASRTLRALEAKQQERLDEVKKLEDSLGLSRQEINHRFSEDVTVAEVLRASTDAEKDLVGRLGALMDVLNESVPAVKAYRAFKRSRDAAIRRQRETPAQKKARDTQQEKLIAAIGRDPASFEGERISFEKRRQLIDELNASDEARTELEALIAATDEAIPLMQERIAEAEKELKRLNAEIAALEALGKKKPRGFQAQLEQKSALAGLPYLIAARDKFAKVPQQMAEDIAAYERDKVTAQSNLATLEEREAELAALFSNDPEVQKARTEAIDARIAKVETNLRNNIEGLKEKKISKTTRESREREVRKYKKELQRLQAQRSTKFGIARKELSTLAPATQAVEAGERLDARKVGPLVKPTTTAGTIRTGDIETTGERKLSPRAPISQSGKAKELPAIAPVAEADTVEDRIMGELDGLERVRQTLEIRVLDAQATNDKAAETGYRATIARVDAQIAEKQAELKAAGKRKTSKKKKETAPATEAAPAAEVAKKQELPKFLSVETLPENIVTSVSRLLPEEQIKALEQIYKADRGSDKFARAIKYDVVNYINSGAQSLARDARTPIAQIAQAAGLKERPRVVYRTSTTGGKGVDYDKLNRMVTEIVKDWENVPTIVTVEKFNDLPADIKAQAIADNMQDVLPGLYSPGTNTVYLVAENLHSKEDVLATMAHEVAGHYGLRSILGRNYADTMNNIYNGNTAVREKADAKMAEMPSLTREVAVEEVLAEMAEVPPAQQTAQEKSALARIYAAIKAWFQRTFGDKVSDAAVQQLVANARRYVTNGGVAGAGGIDTSGIVYRGKPRYASAEMERMGADTDKFVAKQKSFWEKIKANTTGLAFETQLVDRFAGFERLAKYMEPLKGSQMMYYLRMYDQRMNFTAQAVAEGAPVITEKIRADGRKEYVLESKAGPSIKGVVQTLVKAQPMVGNAEAVNRAFTMYLAALRADRVGLAALNFGSDITQQMLDNAKATVANTPGLKEVFDQARSEYNAYNRNMMNFLAETGALSQDVATRLASTNDYIPFYREQNGNAMLIIGGESPVRIGNIAEQPYLQELVGGDTAILDFMTSSVQNTNMLVDMGLRNLATKNAIFELINLNAAKIVKGQPSGPDVVKFKVNGEDRYAVVDTETVTVGGQKFNTGIPAELLVKGMEGIPTQMTGLMRIMAMPAQLLRKSVTLSPLYMAKQLFRDSLAAPILTGANFTPVMGALRTLNSQTKGVLESRGIVGGQQFHGTSEDIAKILRDVSTGKPGWMSALSKVEALGMEADALTRRAQYNSYISQGLSEMEATLMALESMNFNKRGASPSVHMANALIPFLNAQIQGLNVLYRAFTGKMPFNDKLKLQQKLLLRGGMMAAATLLYAALMEDDDAYKNATPDQKYGNWFIRIPGVDEPVRIPVPFEVGYIFKALPEALYSSMTTKHGGEEAVKAFKQILLQTVPGGSSYGLPQALKPAIEVGLGKSFYTGRDILSAREKELLPEEQFRANTSEVAKALGKSLGISPINMEYLVRGYTGTMGLAFLHALSLGAPKSESPEAAVKRLSEYPLVGGAFQPNDAGGIINNTYERFNEDIKVRDTYKKYVEEGRANEANALLQRRGNEIMEAEIGDVFKQNMTKLIQAERAIAASTMSPEAKRKQLDEIRRIKTGLAATYREVADKTTPR